MLSSYQHTIRQHNVKSNQLLLDLRRLKLVELHGGNFARSDDHPVGNISQQSVYSIVIYNKVYAINNFNEDNDTTFANANSSLRLNN